MKRIMILLPVLLLTACAHHRDVRPGAEGVHYVKVNTDDDEAGTRDAISQANHYCEQYGKHAAFIDEDKKYTGDMDEHTYKNGKRMATIAKTAGSAVYAFGGRTESTVGGIATIGGVTADAALGKAYQVKMRFKCQ